MARVLTASQLGLSGDPNFAENQNGNATAFSSLADTLIEATEKRRQRKRQELLEKTVKKAMQDGKLVADHKRDAEGNFVTEYKDLTPSAKDQSAASLSDARADYYKELTANPDKFRGKTQADLEYNDTLKALQESLSEKEAQIQQLQNPEAAVDAVPEKKGNFFTNSLKTVLNALGSVREGAGEAEAAAPQPQPMPDAAKAVANNLSNPNILGGGAEDIESDPLAAKAKQLLEEAGEVVDAANIKEVIRQLKMAG